MESILAESVAAPLHSLHTLSDGSFTATVDRARVVLSGGTEEEEEEDSSSQVSAVVYLAVEARRLGWQPDDVLHALEALATLSSSRRQSLASLCSAANHADPLSSITATTTGHRLPATLHGIRYRVLYRTDTDTDRHSQQPLILLSWLRQPPLPPLHCTATPEALSDLLVQLRDAVKQMDRSSASS
eukprot:gb/GECH01008381.1/.p1 GENE.gb/GECH01008381.1/~~gb/GECH01008381.1/.p1  ORF type:complete len:186 (+),score=40.16 gb/GECH01008381.1/:1-558(+)